VGGGSPIDASKAMIYQMQQENGGEFIRQIAIPTTLSAAEFTVSLFFLAALLHRRP
jgi:alcohol dehydrogenase class IV